MSMKQTRMRIISAVLSFLLVFSGLPLGTVPAWADQQTGAPVSGAEVQSGKTKAEKATPPNAVEDDDTATDSDAELVDAEVINDLEVPEAEPEVPEALPGTVGMEPLKAAAGQEYRVSVDYNYDYGKAYIKPSSSYHGSDNTVFGTTGTVVQLVVEPKPHYHLKEWIFNEGSGEVADDNTFVIGKEDVFIFALFEADESPIEHNIVLTITPPEAGDILYDDEGNAAEVECQCTPEENVYFCNGYSWHQNVNFDIGNPAGVTFKAGKTYFGSAVVLPHPFDTNNGDTVNITSGTPGLKILSVEPYAEYATVYFAYTLPGEADSWDVKLQLWMFDAFGNFVNGIPGLNTATASVKGGGQGTEVTGKTGDKVTLSADLEEGYELTGWEILWPDEGVTIKNNQFTLGGTDVELRPIVTKAATSKVTVLNDNPEMGDAYAYIQSGPQGTEITGHPDDWVFLRAEPKPGCQFVRWEIIEGISNMQWDLTEPENYIYLGYNDVTVKAVFIAEGSYCTITYVDDATTDSSYLHGPVKVSKDEVPAHIYTEDQMNVFAQSNYNRVYFDGWYLDQDYTTPFERYNNEDTLTIYAKWITNVTFQVYDENNNWMETIILLDKVLGTELDFDEMVDEIMSSSTFQDKYDFNGFYISTPFNDTTRVDTLLVRGNDYYYVSVIPAPQYDVTVSIRGSGTATLDIGNGPADEVSGPKGKKVTMKASPENGWKFLKWEVVSGGVTLDKNAASAENSFTLGAADVNIRAVFEKVPVTSVNINTSEKSLYEGETFQLKAWPQPANAYNKAVTWSSSNTAVATVSSTGLVTAVKAGTATITVKTVDGGKTATCKITVQAVTVPVTSVKINTTAKTLAPGATFQMAAWPQPTNATNKNVTWSSSNTAVATVSSTGLVKAVKAGTATITVKTVDGGKTATCAITVKVPVTSVKINATAKTIAPGATFQLAAWPQPSNATNKAVTWTSSNTAVAKVSSTGKVTAVKAGTATITVKTADGGKTATCKITVKVPVTSVKLNATAKTLNVGKTFQLAAWPQPSNATNKAVTWTSSNTTVATVSSTGLVTAKKKGTATITVKTVDGGKTATCKITVN